MIAEGVDIDATDSRGNSAIYQAASKGHADVVEALEGAADLNGDGFVTANEIGTFVTPRVTEDSDAQQTPQSGRLEGKGEVAFEWPRG